MDPKKHKEKTYEDLSDIIDQEIGKRRVEKFETQGQFIGIVKLFPWELRF